MGPKKPSFTDTYQHTVQWTNAGPDGAIWRKSHEVCTILLDKRLFLKNRMMFATKHSVWPSSTLKTVDLEYHSSLLIQWMVRLCLKFYKV